MIILGIETSCDETAAAIVENGNKILSNVVASSIEFHQKTGGIIPEIAAREQVKCIIPVIQKAIENCRLKISDLDGIAVTSGPGLIGSLLVGVETAKTLAYTWQKPLIPVNHLQAHLYANWLIPEIEIPKFPAIGFVVSGGHTDLILMKNHGKIKWLGGTRDDAAGECFDKCARLLKLGYPGGPAISQAAKEFNPKKIDAKIKLPRPMIKDDNFDFSFSGLKTAVLNKVKEQEKEKIKINISQFAYEIQEAITDVLLAKTLRAIKKHRVKSIILAGGVTANPCLREKFKSSILNSKLFIPPPNLCTDNATFIATNAFFCYQPVPWQKVKADSSLEIEEMIKS